MKILNDTLDGLGRWYVAVPPFLILFFLLGIFAITTAGQARLQQAGERVQKSATRAHIVDELQTTLARAVGTQRGFLITNDSKYLQLYNTAVSEVEPQLAQLRGAYGDGEATRADLRDLQLLIGKRLADLSMIRTIQQTQGTSTAIELVKASVGLDAGAAIGAILDRLRDGEARERQAADTHWAAALALSRWVTIAGTLFSMLLVGIAARLVFMDMRRRTLMTTELRDQKSQLERDVEQRTQELVELSTHLQSVSEREKASLARELHDELGGLLVGARMDISWAEQHLAQDNSDIKHRLNRVQQNLAAGVDLKRRIIEELRPTLLDNVGLYAALRWQLKESCGNAGLQCIESYPDEEPRFKSEASIALFRIAQEAFSNILKHADARTVDVSLDMDAENLLLRIADDGKGMATERVTAIGSHGMASMRHRVRALGGRLDVRSPATGGTMLVVQIPTKNAVVPHDQLESTSGFAEKP